LVSLSFLKGMDDCAADLGTFWKKVKKTALLGPGARIQKGPAFVVESFKSWMTRKPMRGYAFQDP